MKARLKVASRFLGHSVGRLQLISFSLADLWYDMASIYEKVLENIMENAMILFVMGLIEVEDTGNGLSD